MLRSKMLRPAVPAMQLPARIAACSLAAPGRQRGAARIGRAARRLALAAALLFPTAALHASQAAPQDGKKPAGEQPKAVKTDQLSVRSKRDGSLQLMAGVLSANNLDNVTLQVSGKETKV